MRPMKFPRRFPWLIAPVLLPFSGVLFLPSGTLVLGGLSTGPALLPGSLFRERLRGRPLHRGGPSAVAVARGWPRLALIR